MPQYLLTMYQPDGDPPPPEVLGPMMEKIAAWRQDLQAAGAWGFTGIRRLHAGDIRILYEVDDATATIHVINIGILH